VSDVFDHDVNLLIPFHLFDIIVHQDRLSASFFFYQRKKAIHYEIGMRMTFGSNRVEKRMRSRL
jgi:hypothetical protein